MLFVLIFAAAVLWSEKCIKARIRSAAPGTLPCALLKGHIRLEHVENSGFSASRWKNRPEVVQVIHLFAALLSIFSTIPEIFRRKEDGLFHIGAGLLIGGSLANLWDRVFRGSVTDYLRFPTLPWKKIRSLVFNLADLCIFLGAALMFLRLLFPKRK